MNLFSVWRSTSVEILLSKRIVGFVYALMGLAILAEIAHSYFQFFHAYITLGEFDVTPETFIGVTIFFLFPLWLVGAVILRAVLQRIRIALWIRSAIKVVAYDTKLTPAEAGYLVDYSYSNRELVATLLDLHFRGVIYLSINESVISIALPNTDAPVSSYENALLYTLNETSDGTYYSFNDPRLVKAAQYAHQLLIQDLTEREIIQPERLPSRGFRIFFRTISAVSAILALGQLSTLLTNPNQILDILYPRYPIEPFQVGIMVVFALVLIAVLVSSLWPRLTRDHKTAGYATWIDAAGLLMYIRGVFKRRFSEEHITLQDANTLRDYSAYAIAYGIIPNSPRMVAKIIDTTSNNK